MAYVPFSSRAKRGFEQYLYIISLSSLNVTLFFLLLLLLFLLSFGLAFFLLLLGAEPSLEYATTNGTDRMRTKNLTARLGIFHTV